MTKDELNQNDTSSEPVSETHANDNANKSKKDYDHLHNSTSLFESKELAENSKASDTNVGIKEEENGSSENGKNSEVLTNEVETKLEQNTADEIEFQNKVTDATIDELKQEADELLHNNINQSLNGEDDEDEFDDFDEFAAAEPNNNHEEDDFDEFGDFDEFDTFEQPSNYIQPDIDPAFPDSCFSNKADFESRLSKLLSKLFITDESAKPTSLVPEETGTDKSTESLLNNRSRTIYKQISTMPYLHPPNWIRLDIRHNLLIKLGIPINLDELNANATIRSQNSNTFDISTPESEASLSNHHLTVPSHHQRSRKKSISEQDINWSNFTIPDFNSLKLTNDQIQQILTTTNDTLSKFEYDLMENSSSQYLQNVKLDDILDAKLKQLSLNHQELLKLSSIWQHQLVELRKDYEIYEQVVQSCIGYSQKLRREEILENLKKMKHSSSSSTATSSSSSSSKQKKKFWKK